MIEINEENVQNLQHWMNFVCNYNKHFEKISTWICKIVQVQSASKQLELFENYNSPMH